MADNVEITAGSGTTIATDDASGAHVQIVKLALSADGSATPITADSDGLEVQIAKGTVDTVTTITNVVHVDDNAGALTVDGTVTANLGATDNAVLDAIEVDTSAIAAAVDIGGHDPGSGVLIQGIYDNLRENIACDTAGRLYTAVYSLPELAAGNNAIGKLAANSGVDIGDVDVTSVIPGVGATNLGKAEDAAHSSGDVGVMALAIRDDTLAAFSGAENDYEPLHTTTAGRLHVASDLATVATVAIVTGGVDGSQSVGGPTAADAAIAARPITIGGRASTAVPSAMSADGDVVDLWLTRRGGIVNEGPGLADVALPATAPVITGGRGSTATPSAMSADGDVTVNWLTRTGATVVDGGIAHDAADAGSPVKVGGKALTALGTSVATADRTDFIADVKGRQLVSHIDPTMATWKSANYTTAQTGAVVWDPAAGKRVAITSIVIGSYGTTAGRLILYLAANGDTTYSAGTDQLVLAASFAPSATSTPGLVFTPSFPVFGTADHELMCTTSAALSVDIAVYGYEF